MVIRREIKVHGKLHGDAPPATVRQMLFLAPRPVQLGKLWATNYLAGPGIAQPPLEHSCPRKD